MSENISVRSILFFSPVMALFSLIIFLDYSYPRLFTAEKILWGLFVLTLVAVCITHKKIKEIPNSIIYLLIFFIFQCINGIIHGASFRDFSGAFTLYLFPIIFTIYLYINNELTSLIINNIPKLVKFFIICIFSGMLFSFLFLDGYRYQVFNPFIYIFSSMLLINKFNIKSILLFGSIILVILFSNIRAPIFFLFLILLYSYLYNIRITRSSKVFGFFLLMLISIIFVFGFQFLTSFGRYETLANIQSIFLWEDLYLNKEFSLLTRILEIQSILIQMESSNYLTFLFGNGIGSAFIPSGDLLYATSMAGGNYGDLVRTGGIHNIHVGIFATFFRLGLIGIILHFLLLITIFKESLISKGKDFWIHLSSLSYLLNDLLYSSLQSSVFILSISLSACIIMKKKITINTPYN